MLVELSGWFWFWLRSWRFTTSFRSPARFGLLTHRAYGFAYCRHIQIVAVHLGGIQRFQARQHNASLKPRAFLNALEDVQPPISSGAHQHQSLFELVRHHKPVHPWACRLWFDRKVGHLNGPHHLGRR